MKKRKIYKSFGIAVGIMLLAILSSNINGDIPYGSVSAVTEEDCRTCHNVGVIVRHHYFVNTYEYACSDCHPIQNGGILIERNCINCHNGTAFYANPELNPGAPLHLPVNITITSPDAEDNWVKGSNRTIKWDYTGNPGPEVTIQLLKSGVLNQNITSISKGTNGSGSYIWAIPSSMEIGNDYQIRINSMLSTTGVIYTNNSDYFSITRHGGKQ